MKRLHEVIGAFPESSAKVRLQFQQPLLHKLKQSVLLRHSDTTDLQKGWSQGWRGICSRSCFQWKYEGLTIEHPLCRWGLWLLNKLRKQSWGYVRRKSQLHFFKPSLTFSSRNSNQKSILFFCSRFDSNSISNSNGKRNSMSDKLSSKMTYSLAIY